MSCCSPELQSSQLSTAVARRLKQALPFLFFWTGKLQKQDWCFVQVGSEIVQFFSAEFIKQDIVVSGQFCVKIITQCP